MSRWLSNGQTSYGKVDKVSNAAERSEGSRHSTTLKPPSMQRAENARGEPNLTDAANCMNVWFGLLQNF